MRFSRASAGLVGIAFSLGCEGESSGGGGSGAASGQGGSSAGGAGGSSSDEIWIAYCDDEEARARSCGNTNFTLADCASYAPCTTLYKPAAVDAITKCLLARECSVGSDDACSSEGLTSGSPSPSVAAFKSKCSSYVDACNAAGTPIWEDLATICLANQLSDAFGPAFNACFAKPCAEFRACFDDVAANQFGCVK